MPMTSHDKRRLRASLSAKYADKRQLDEAKNHYWYGRYSEAGKLIYDLSYRLIKEPLKNTKEYKDGERKPDIPFKEQPQEKSSEKIVTYENLFAAGEIHPNAPEPERDDDGYLIR